MNLLLWYSHNKLRHETPRLYGIPYVVPLEVTTL